MSRDIEPEGQDLERAHIIRTRQEALREALKARRPPEPPREFSTLVRRSEAAQNPLAVHDPAHCLHPGCVPDARYDAAAAAEAAERDGAG